MLSIAIQAGGNSSRMEEDKALRLFLGRPLIERVIERLRPAADEILVTTNRPAEYAFLGLPLFTDVKPGRGALGGLYTALSAATHPLVGVVACDMPFASLAVLQTCAQLLADEQVDVAMAETQGGLEPMHAVYRRSTCLPVIESAMQAGLWKAIGWLPQVRVRVLTARELERCDPQGLAFLNVNTPQQFAEAERLALADD
jgi:molybdopterin-guanine dinucleotide biosynthesis protein A